jgi:hypothetical protein
VDLCVGPWYRPNVGILSERTLLEREVKRLQQLATKNCELKMGQSSGVRRVYPEVELLCLKRRILD